MFHNVFDSGIIIKQNDNRLAIRICKHKNPTTTITFETFEKYKRQPYYFDTLFLDMTDTPIQNQIKLSNHILNDDMLLEFFMHENKAKCYH